MGGCEALGQAIEGEVKNTGTEEIVGTLTIDLEDCTLLSATGPFSGISIEEVCEELSSSMIAEEAAKNITREGLEGCYRIQVYFTAWYDECDPSYWNSTTLYVCNYSQRRFNYHRD